MANMQESDRNAAAGLFMRELSNIREEIGDISRSDIKAAVDAVDSWIETNAVLYNNSLPIPFRQQATVSQKARLLTIVAERRFNVGA